MRSPQLLLQGRVEYSYGQVMVFDSQEREPGSAWTDTHVAQGFVRRATTVAFVTLDNYGLAPLRVFAGVPRRLDAYARVVSVCVDCSSGLLSVEGPEEPSACRQVEVGRGVQQVICAQAGAEGGLHIDLYVQAVDAVVPSEILKADFQLHPPTALVE